MERAIKKKQEILDIQDAENKKLQDDLEKIKEKIESKKEQERKIRAQIEDEETKANDIVADYEAQIDSCKNESQQTRDEFNARIMKTCNMQD